LKFVSRTGEMLLTVLGIIVFGFFAVIGGATIWMNKNPDKVAEMLEAEDIETNENVDLSTDEFLALVDEIGTSGWIVLSGSILAILLGLVAIFLLRQNKHPKAAGIILLATAVISTFMTFFLGFIGGIIYVITGIMALVRKPKLKEI